MKLIESVKI